MDTPLITIIIPTFNRADFIGQSIESVLAQTYEKWEMIVIDDASTDSTESLMKTYVEKDNRIRYIKNPINLGISKSRNIGLHSARATYIAMLDSDDVWLDPEKLAKQIGAFKKNSGHTKPLGIVGTWVTQIDEGGKTLRNISFAENDAGIRQSFLYVNHIAQSSVLFLKQAALDAGGYDETLATMEDHDLWLNIGMKYEVETLPIYATGYRIHSQSITKKRRERVALDEMSVIRRWKNSYPGATHGLIKGYLRLLRAYF
jgi:glycosyltransferase involved in cell wall biosynthesis